MSRFYDALREASRLPNGHGTVKPVEPARVTEAEVIAESLWKAFTTPGENGKDAAPPVPLAEPVMVVAEPAPAASEESAVPELQPEGAPQPPEASDQTTAEAPAFPAPRRIVFHKEARLIPHTTDTAVVEHYRRLRTKILQQQATKPFRSLVVTSPNPLEGKTVTVLNLGLSFAMLPSLKVLVVDGDLRRGSLGRWLDAEERPGFSNLIDGSARLENVLLKSEETGVHFLVRGTSQVSPAELLNSTKLRSQVRRMTEDFDLVLVDSPPVNLIADAQLLAASCDAVLLIARAFSTTRKAFEKTVQDMQQFRVIGSVLNGGTRAPRYRRYRGYY